MTQGRFLSCFSSANTNNSIREHTIEGEEKGGSEEYRIASFGDAI